MRLGGFAVILEVLYPEISGLFGDRRNPDFLLRAVPELECVKTALKSRPAFTDGGAKMVYLGSMTERAQKLCAEALSPYKSQLEEQIDGGTVFLVTGNAIELFGKYIENEDGTKTEMLGLFDFYTKRRMMNRYNSLYLGKFGETYIVGFISRFSHMYGNAGDELFKTVRGAGREPGVTAEGILKNNFMATYTQGPLLALNPLFLKVLLQKLGFPDNKVPFEKAATAAYEQRLREFIDPKTLEKF